MVVQPRFQQGDGLLRVLRRLAAELIHGAGHVLGGGADLLEGLGERVGRSGLDRGGQPSFRRGEEGACRLRLSPVAGQQLVQRQPQPAGARSAPPCQTSRPKKTAASPAASTAKTKSNS